MNGPRHLLFVLALSSLCAAPARASERPLRVVAVGDSYASGEGAIGPGWSNAACHRSSLAAPQDAARRLNGLRSTFFDSLACTGATSSDVVAQLAGVGSPYERIDALTISVGGNDLDFSNIVTSCMVPPPYECHLDPNVTSPLATNLSGLPAKLDSVVAAVQGPGKRTPGDVRQVFVTEYPDPTQAPLGAHCGAFGVPGFQLFDGIDEAEATWAASEVVGRLNTELARMVDRANAQSGSHPRWHYVSGISQRFHEHGYCTGGGGPNPMLLFTPRYIATPVDSVTSQGDVMGAMHPNDLGQQQIAAALFDAESFLTQPLAVSAATDPPAVAGVPTQLSVSVTTQSGDSVPNATVTVLGQSLRTDARGSASLTLTFPARGLETVSADADPYPITNARLAVAAAAFTLIGVPAKLPLKTTTTFALEARDQQSGALVPGTFTLRDETSYYTLRSGAAPISVRVDSTTTQEGETETDARGKPRVVRSKIVHCPTLTFVPDDGGRYEPSDGGALVDCVDTSR